ncbi:MAG: hypothetical protein COA79_26520 [Planctomycetota bacterium]|nr:MAG: hypothetical protein COA79_26520 [Planctomycetota bacterium]
MNHKTFYILLVLICLFSSSYFVPFLRFDLNTEKAKGIAIAELQKWVSKNPIDAHQIQGASFKSVSIENKIIHITLFKDVSIKNANGVTQSEGMHLSYFHVYLNFNYEVQSVRRGPDLLS